MMEKKYQLVAWTRNITDERNARVYFAPSVMIDLLEPLIAEANECRKIQETNSGHISPELAGRFVRVYEQAARLDILTGHIGYAIRFLLQAASYCVVKDDPIITDHETCREYRTELRNEFIRLCEEAISLARKHGREYVLMEEKCKSTLKRYYAC